MKFPIAAALVLTMLVLIGKAPAQNAAASGAGQSKDVSSEAASPSRTAPEERFKAMLTDAYLTGRWAPLKDGELGEEQPGDKYNIVSVTKASGENWIVRAKLKYRDQEFVLPIPVQVKFVADAAIMIVDKLTIPGGGTYSARVMFYDNTYSGTWSGGRNGGMLYGAIIHDKKENASGGK